MSVPLPGLGLYLLASAIEERSQSQDYQCTASHPSDDEKASSRPRSPSTMEKICDTFAASILESALNEVAMEQYSGSFVGDLLYFVYERQAKARRREAVDCIERWYQCHRDRQRMWYGNSLMQASLAPMLNEVSHQQQSDFCALMLQRWWRGLAAVQKRHALASQFLRKRATLFLQAEEQELRLAETAACRIQRLVRVAQARRRVALRLVARARTQRRVILCEAAGVIFCFLRANADRRIFIRRRHHVRQTAIATVLQQFCRAHLDHIHTSQMQLHVANRSASSIQLMWKCWRSRNERRRRQLIAEHKQRSMRIHEAVVRLQSYMRMFTCRSKYVKARRIHRAVPLLQRVARGFRSRALGIAPNRNRELAARCLQRFAKLIFARRFRTEAQTYLRQRRRLDILEYAAHKIQRMWAKRVARRVVEDARQARQQKTAAALLIQRNARVWAAKCHLHRLQQASENDAFNRGAHQAARLLQSNVRGWLARRRVHFIRLQRQENMRLICRVAANYLFRKDLSMYYYRNMRERAARCIQSAYRGFKELQRADSRYRMRLAYVRGVRRKNLAAVVIQKYWRCFAATQQFRDIRHRRHRATIKIQTRVRILLAQRVLDSLIDVYRQDLAARRIQMMWLATADKFRQKRCIHEYEAMLADMEVTAVQRKEAMERAVLHQQAEQWWSRELLRFNTLHNAMAARYAERLDEWRASNPPELQQEAAVRIQASIRGLLQRRRLCSGSHPGFTTAERQLQEDADAEPDVADDMLEMYFGGRRIRRSGGADPSRTHKSCSRDATGVQQIAQGMLLLASKEGAAPSRSNGIEISMSLSWMEWLAERPHLTPERHYSRLLHREANARENIKKLYDVTLAMLQSEAAVPANARLRPILALAQRGAASSVSSRALQEEVYETPQHGVTLPPLMLPTTSASLLQRGMFASAGLHTSYLPPVSEHLQSRTEAARQSSMITQYQSISLNCIATTGISTGVTDTAEPSDQESRTLASLSAHADALHVSTCDLRSMNLTESQLSLILEKLKSSNVFRRLLLGNNRCTDAVCSSVADVMLANHSITEYSLENNPITDTGATHLVAALARAHHVLLVDVNGTYITEPYRQHMERLQRRHQEAHRLMQDTRGDEPDNSRPKFAATLFEGLRSFPPKHPLCVARESCPPAPRSQGSVLPLPKTAAGVIGHNDAPRGMVS